MENRFNLIEEPWIPVADYGRASLRDIFSKPDYQSLGGNPVQKIAVFKLLLAIAQAAATPADEKEWREVGAQGMAKKCLTYLDKWHDRFFLYGNKPFLQMPKIVEKIQDRTNARMAAANTPAKKKDAQVSGLSKGFGSGFYPDLPSENNTLLSHTLMERVLFEPEKALFLVALMNFSFGGKRVEADMTTLGGVKLGNRHSAKAGPSLGGYWGYLHSYVFADSIMENVWLNTLTVKNIEQIGRWESGLGVPVWEQMPITENDKIAEDYKKSYLATLVALSRFVQLEDSGVFYCEGLSYPNTKDGWYELSLTLDMSGKDIRVKYVDTERRPWRELDGLLSFSITGQSSGFECLGLKLALERARDCCQQVSFWSGGLRTSSNSGDQSVKQSDDFVESSVILEVEAIRQGGFVEQIKHEMNGLDDLAKVLYVRVHSYLKSFEPEKEKKKLIWETVSKNATNMFWQLCERDFQTLVNSCDTTDEAKQARQQLRRKFARYQHQAYDHFCANETARQIDAWAQNRPNHYTYIIQEAS